MYFTTRQVGEGLAVLGAVGSIAWFIFEPDFEPAAAAFASASGLVMSYVDRQTKATRTVTRRLFKALEEDLPRRGSLAFLAEHDFDTRFADSALDDLIEFRSKWGPEHNTFVHWRLRRKLNTLREAIDSFLQVLAEQTVPIGEGGSIVDPALEGQVPAPITLIREARASVLNEYEDLYADAVQLVRGDSKPR